MRPDSRCRTLVLCAAISNNLLVETDTNNTINAVYSFDPEKYGNLTSQRRGIASSFYHFDGLGSTDSITDSNGTITDRYLYRAFGESTVLNDSTENSFRYLGRVGYSQESELTEYFVRARWYDPRLGRFKSCDPLSSWRLSSPIGVNLYIYTDNSPVNAIDPSGLDYVKTRIRTCNVYQEGGLFDVNSGVAWYLGVGIHGFIDLDGVGYGFYEESNMCKTWCTPQLINTDFSRNPENTCRSKCLEDFMHNRTPIISVTWGLSRCISRCQPNVAPGGSYSICASYMVDDDCYDVDCFNNAINRLIAHQPKVYIPLLVDCFRWRNNVISTARSLCFSPKGFLSQAKCTLFDPPEGIESPPI